MCTAAARPPKQRRPDMPGCTHLSWGECRPAHHCRQPSSSPALPQPAPPVHRSCWVAWDRHPVFRRATAARALTTCGSPCSVCGAGPQLWPAALSSTVRWRGQGGKINKPGSSKKANPTATGRALADPKSSFNRLHNTSPLCSLLPPETGRKSCANPLHCALAERPASPRLLLPLVTLG